MSGEKGGDESGAPLGQAATYAAAGVDIAAGDTAVELMRDRLTRARRPEVRGNLGGFAGLFALDTSRYRQPLLASSTDGVGTKVAIAQAMDVHDTIGRDLVAMVVDDLVVTGAEPLFMEDYIACGRVVPERVASIVSGIVDGCVAAGCALVGGETAEHPDLMAADAYDISGTGIGVVEADELLGTDRVQAKDVLIAMGSSGLHSNGYSLVRHVLLQLARMPLEAHVEELGRTLGEELLEPTRIYARDCLALAAAADVHAFSHITGGGLPGNLTRVIPAGAEAVVDLTTWTPPAVFELVARRGHVAPEEMQRTFNLGVGMVAVVGADAADRALAELAARGLPSWVLGEVRVGAGDADASPDGGGSVRFVGKHPR